MKKPESIEYMIEWTQQKGSTIWPQKAYQRRLRRLSWGLSRSSTVRLSEIGRLRTLPDSGADTSIWIVSNSVPQAPSVVWRFRASQSHGSSRFTNTALNNTPRMSFSFLERMRWTEQSRVAWEREWRHTPCEPIGNRTKRRSIFFKRLRTAFEKMTLAKKIVIQALVWVW